MRRKEKHEADPRVKRKILGWKSFALTYSILLLLVGIQVGLIVVPFFSKMSVFLQINTILLYWAGVALIFSLITKWQILHSYDIPMRTLSNAAKEVAGGDFSVYVEPPHTADKYDYIDVMFTDFNVMVQELGSIETLKNDFVANVSHEIKTPLAVIRNYTDALKKDSLSPEMRAEYIDAIITATDNLSALVSNILRLNKLENRELEQRCEEYNLCRQLCDCALRFESLWEDKGIEFAVSIEEKATITADRDMLELVWNNLLSNALKFTNAGGKITLTQTSDNDTVTVSVTDTGCGMTEETQKRIFDKFYQGDTSHSSEGNGLGLAISRRVVEKSGGTISVTSEINKGSTFTVTLKV
jgi:Signal transduction histidine kinase